MAALLGDDPAAPRDVARPRAERLSLTALGPGQGRAGMGKGGLPLMVPVRVALSAGSLLSVATEEPWHVEVDFA